MNNSFGFPQIGTIGVQTRAGSSASSIVSKLAGKGLIVYNGKYKEAYITEKGILHSNQPQEKQSEVDLVHEVQEITTTHGPVGRIISNDKLRRIELATELVSDEPDPNPPTNSDHTVIRLRQRIEELEAEIEGYKNHIVKLSMGGE